MRANLFTLHIFTWARPGELKHIQGGWLGKAPPLIYVFMFLCFFAQLNKNGKW